MPLERKSPCKVNLLLNILGRRSDGFHELETVLLPVPWHDRITFERSGDGIQLTTNAPDLPVTSDNLIHRAAHAFLQATRLQAGVRIHLEKNIPMAAGLGGGSGNAASTLLGLNELFDHPLSVDQLHPMAAQLGSDVPFFLQAGPALATGRGEIIQPLEPFPALNQAGLVLVRPDFGIPTAWAYKHLAQFHDALHGQAGRAQALVKLLQEGSLSEAGPAFYNSLEAPAYHKYPFLKLLKEFFLENGAPAALMSGSGSTMFAILPTPQAAMDLEEKVRDRFGRCWSQVVPLP